MRTRSSSSDLPVAKRRRATEVSGESGPSPPPPSGEHVDRPEGALALAQVTAVSGNDLGHATAGHSDVVDSTSTGPVMTVYESQGRGPGHSVNATTVIASSGRDVASVAVAVLDADLIDDANNMPTQASIDEREDPSDEPPLESTTIAQTGDQLLRDALTAHGFQTSTVSVSTAASATGDAQTIAPASLAVIPVVAHILGDRPPPGAADSLEGIDLPSGSTDIVSPGSLAPAVSAVGPSSTLAVPAAPATAEALAPLPPVVATPIAPVVSVPTPAEATAAAPPWMAAPVPVLAAVAGPPVTVVPPPSLAVPPPPPMGVAPAAPLVVAPAAPLIDAAALVVAVPPAPPTAAAPAPANAANTTANAPPDAANAPANFFIDLADVPQEILQRIFNISNAMDVTQNVYSVSRVPQGADWGRGRLDRTLCYNGAPVTILLVAVGRTYFFYKPDGQPQGRINSGFTMATLPDLEAVRRLYMRAQPRASLTSEYVYAGRLQTVRERGEAIAQAVPFEEVYDATAEFRMRPAMPRLTPADLAENDILVVECTLTRWKKPADMRKKQWTSWSVGFELQSIALLYAAPPPADANATPAVQPAAGDFAF
ncbi:hypothetical protein C8Q78DRAFT_988915 [Trametes maxima]|nr:hypothetical protein C8Q78DRAFT_988915 [Trametes maxima]